MHKLKSAGLHGIEVHIETNHMGHVIGEVSSLEEEEQLMAILEQAGVSNWDLGFGYDSNLDL